MLNGPDRSSSVGGVAEAWPDNHRAGSGATPTPALQTLLVTPIPIWVAKQLIVLYHYLRSLPGGTKLAFGVFLGALLKGVITFGVGPVNAFRLVEGCTPDECLTLTRLWLSDDLPKNSESRVIGIVLKALKKHTNLRFLVSYADPAQGHVGTIYQATNWLYTGLSEAMPLYDLGDGIARHSRSFAHVFGTHSVKHFKTHGIDIKVVPQGAKHRYLYLLDPSLRPHLNALVLPYPKKESTDDDDS